MPGDKNAYEAFQVVDDLVSKPVVGSDGAKSWQNFQASDKAIASRNMAPKAPLKRADRASGILSWEHERRVEHQSRDGKVSQGYTHFKKRPGEDQENVVSKKHRKMIETRTRPDTAAYYIPADTFDGSKKDYIFTTRNGKTGYYWDGTDSLKELRGETIPESSSSSIPPKNTDAAQEGANDAPSEKKRKKKKKNKAPEIVHDPNHPLEQIASRLHAALPPGWQAAQDRTTGKTYYYNRVTSQRQWEAPSDGWSSAVDAASGKTYYFNAKTNETKWEKPT